MLFTEHVGITVSDLAVSERFYSTLFGEPAVDHVTWRGKNAEYVARMMGQPGLTLDAVFFRLPGSNILLEVIEFHGLEDTGSGQATRHYQIGGVHLGFYVPDIDPLIKRIVAAGSELLGEPVQIEFGPYMGTGGRSATFRDPDENNLQLMEITARPGRLPIPS